MSADSDAGAWLRGNGARSRTRTGTALRPADFRPTSAFAAPRGFVGWSTPSPWPRGFRRPPSALYTFPQESQAWLGVRSHLSCRAFAEFDGLHREHFYSRAQSFVLSPLRMPF